MGTEHILTLLRAKVKADKERLLTNVGIVLSNKSFSQESHRHGWNINISN